MDTSTLHVSVPPLLSHQVDHLPTSRLIMGPQQCESPAVFPAQCGHELLLWVGPSR